MWDCSWKVNPYLGYFTVFDPLEFPFISTLPRIPVDLHCLDGCVAANNPTKGVPCGGRSHTFFLLCYLFFTLENPATDLWVAAGYFDLPVEFCLLAYLKPDLYNNGNCENLNVNLSIFNKNLDPPYLDSSLDINTTTTLGEPNEGALANAAKLAEVNLPIFKSGLDPRYLDSSRDIVNITKLAGPNEGAVANAIQLGDRLSGIPLKRRHPWACSLQTQGYTGIHRCGVTLLSGPPNATIFVSAAHCNYVCKNSANQVVQICCCQVSHIYKNI